MTMPSLIRQHYEDFRLAQSKLHTSYASGLDSSDDANSALAQIFHSIQSHLALSPSGSIDQTYLRQSIDHVLKACLPEQDWNSEVERSIVREIVVGPICGAAVSRLTQPWFLHGMFLSLVGRPGGAGGTLLSSSVSPSLTRSPLILVAAAPRSTTTTTNPFRANCFFPLPDIQTPTPPNHSPHPHPIHLHLLSECHRIHSAHARDGFHHQCSFLALPSISFLSRFKGGAGWGERIRSSSPRPTSHCPVNEGSKGQFRYFWDLGCG